MSVSNGYLWTPTGFLTAERYTSSLDTALSLVPEGCADITIDWIGRDWAAWVNAGNQCTNRQERPTAALALCIAALRARATKEQAHG